MTLVVDASALVGLFGDRGAEGEWLADVTLGRQLAAPELVRFEAANALRRLEITGELDASQAALAHVDILRLRMETWPYQELADRVWQLRGSLTAYDASYVALAERLRAPLVTRDRRLARASGPRCEFLTPPR